MVERIDQATPLPEPEQAYENAEVVRAFTHSDWFTPAYIEEVQQNEPSPEQVGLSGYSDQRLAAFLRQEDFLGKGNEAYLDAVAYVHDRMVNHQGHPFTFETMVFNDKEIKAYARTLGVTEGWGFEREMSENVGNTLLCLVAPTDLRRKVVRLMYKDQQEEAKTNMLLWSQLVRNGAKKYVQEVWNTR